MISISEYGVAESSCICSKSATICLDRSNDLYWLSLYTANLHCRYEYLQHTTQLSVAVMKPVINALIAVSALGVPVLSFSQQSPSPVTRAQVRAELGQLEAAGFKGPETGPYYPANLHAAEARVARQNASQAPTSNYGPPAAGSSQSGQPRASADTQ